MLNLTSNDANHNQNDNDENNPHLNSPIELQITATNNTVKSGHLHILPPHLALQSRSIRLKLSGAVLQLFYISQ